MSEKKFLNCIMVEGFVLMIIGLCILILPKLTSLSFAVMLSAAFIIYGIYKTISSFVNKNYHPCFLLSLVSGILLATLGILILFVPNVSLLWLIALIGVYFLLDSINTTAFAVQLKSVYNMWGAKCITAIILFLIGIVIILGLPVMSFWMVTMLSGIAILIKGMTKIALALVNKNNYTL